LLRVADSMTSSRVTDTTERIEMATSSSISVKPAE
jgi:hypothetical protein